MRSLQRRRDILIDRLDLTLRLTRLPQRRDNPVAVALFHTQVMLKVGGVDREPPALVQADDLPELVDEALGVAVGGPDP